MSEFEVRAFAAIQLNQAANDLRLERVYGGDINLCFKAVGADGNAVFIKANSDRGVLESEYLALCRLSELGAVCFPQALSFSAEGTTAMLALEFHQIIQVDQSTSKHVAKVIVDMHNISGPKFGWETNGYIGLSVQSNRWCSDWCEFFSEQRLRPQLGMAMKRGISSTIVRRVEQLIVELDQIIDSENIKPMLIHGDLWTGNIGYSMTRRAGVIYDPAPYFGDPEADIAMSRLFGCLPDGFYQAYRSVNPEPQDIKPRTAIYNIYHALNHFNLFGSSYTNLVNSLLDEVGIT